MSTAFTEEELRMSISKCDNRIEVCEKTIDHQNYLRENYAQLLLKDYQVDISKEESKDA